MGEEKRKREGAVSEADKALKSPKSPRLNVAGKSLQSLGLQDEDVQAAAAALSDSSGSSSDGAGDSGRCHHMLLDSESVDMAIYDIKFSGEIPKCHHPRCRITWKGDGENKEGMMKCIDCHYVSCARGLVREDPRGHALWHAEDSKHMIAQWYDEPNLGYCFGCTCVMRLSDNQDQFSEDEPAKVDRKLEDERAMVASKTKDNRGMVDHNSKVDLAMVASSSQVDRASVARSALDQLRMGARNDARSHAMGNGYVIRAMPNHENTCYMNASLQCLLALGKLRTMILQPDARLGDIGRDLKQLFVETGNVNNATHMLDPQMILVYMRSLYPKRFEVRKMEDSHEFLTSLRNALDDEVMELNRMHIMEGRDVFPTFGLSIFSGKLIKTVSCKSCLHNSVDPIDFSELIFPLLPKDPPPARSVAECGNSQIPGLGLGDGAIEETPKPLQVDSTEVKDVVQSCLETQKNDVPLEMIEVPIALNFIPNLFDDTEGMEDSTAYSHNPDDKGKAQSSNIVHVEAGHMKSLPSIQDCLTLFSHELKNCENCSKVAEVLETSGSKNVRAIMASTDVDATIDGDQTELSDRETSPSEQSSDFSSLSVGKSRGEKDLASCSTANEKAESHEGAAPSFLPTDTQTDLLSAQDIQDTSTQKQGSGKQVIYDHSAQQVAEKQNKQTDGNGVATQTQLIRKLPPVLTIQLMRYTPDLSKLEGHVSFKEILHLGPFMEPSSEDKTSSSYHLVGVIVHSGDTRNKGHYIAYVRGSGSSWVCADDCNISVVSLEQVLGCEAYILFYERMEDQGMPDVLPTN